MTDTVRTWMSLVAFWGSALLTAYGYLGYPLVMYAWGRLRGRQYTRGNILPTVSLLVPAHNEAHVIGAKIKNCLDLEYPPDRLEIVVASDGSTDGTAEIIHDAARAGRIAGLVFARWRGKVAVLNDLVSRASGEIIVFSDASSMLERASIRALVSNFADPRVGCVSGIYRIRHTHGDSQGAQEGLYWRYETFVRLAEATCGTMLGAHGALYAIRRELYEPLDPSVINDDFVVPLSIVLNGWASIYEPHAVAWEDAHEMVGFPRRIRIMMGNIRQLALLGRTQGWRRPRILWQLVSHKGLRVAMPLLLLTLYVSNLALLGGPVYRACFVVQTLFLGAGLLGLSPRLRRLGGPLIAAPYYVCMANGAALVGLYRVLLGRAAVEWAPPGSIEARKQRATSDWRSPGPLEAETGGTSRR